MRQGLRFPFANSAALWGITGALVLLYISDLTFISDLIFFLLQLPFALISSLTFMSLWPVMSEFANGL